MKNETTRKPIMFSKLWRIFYVFILFSSSSSHNAFCAYVLCWLSLWCMSSDRVLYSLRFVWRHRQNTCGRWARQRIRWASRVRLYLLYHTHYVWWCCSSENNFFLFSLFCFFVGALERAEYIPKLVNNTFWNGFCAIHFEHCVFIRIFLVCIFFLFLF